MNDVILKGPIPITNASYPFCTMKYSIGNVDISQYDFCEEEYFIKGKANIYDLGEDKEPFVVEKDVDYANRILVRRPKDQSKFSGIVFVDILNATNNYDIEDLWRRSYDFIMENNHGYVGITSKPCNVQSLKTFDPERYKELTWASPLKEFLERTDSDFPLTYTPGMETGLIWDIISQTGYVLRGAESKKIFGENRPKYVYLTGQSQSGMYLNTFVNTFHKHTTLEDGKSVFDGYLNTVGAFGCVALRDHSNGHLPDYNIKSRNVPMITISAEGDLYLFSSINGGKLQEIREDNDDANDRFRYYEIPGAPHSDPLSPCTPNNDSIIRTGNPGRNLDNVEGLKGKNLNDLPLRYFVNSALYNLHQWSAFNITPPKGERILLGTKSPNVKVCKDELGNALGGVRHPFVEVPAATYDSVAGHEISSLTIGSMQYFSLEDINSLYGSFDKYYELFKANLEKTIKAGYLLDADKGKILDLINTKYKNHFQAQGE